MASSCLICFEEFSQDTVRASPDACDHIFCLPCLEKWSKFGSYCPIDRKRYRKICNLDSESVIQVKPRKRKKRGRVLYDFTTKCELCLQDNTAELLLLCDSCDLAFHTTCLSPPLKEVPAGLWFCPPCVSVEGRIKEKNGITKEVEADLCSFNQKELEVKDLKSLQAKELEIFKAKCNKNNTFMETCSSVAVDFRNIEANSCQNGDRLCAFEDDESKLDKITKTFNFETDNSKTPFKKSTRSYSLPVNKKTKKMSLRLNRKKRVSEEIRTHSKLDDLCLKDSNVAEGDLLDPFPKDVLFGDIKLDAFSDNGAFETHPILKKKNPSHTSMLLSNKESEHQSVNLFESVIQDPSDKLNSQEIVGRDGIELFAENENNYFKETDEEDFVQVKEPEKLHESAVPSDDMPRVTAFLYDDESSLEYTVENARNDQPASEGILSGAKTCTSEPSLNNSNTSLPSNFERIFLKKKNSKEKEKNSIAEEDASSKKKRNRKRISKKKGNISPVKKKKMSKLKKYFLSKHWKKHISDSDTGSSHTNCEADVSTSKSISSLFSLNDENQNILDEFGINSDVASTSGKNLMFRKNCFNGIDGVDVKKHTYQPSQSVNTFNLHLHCGNMESKENDSQQKLCSASHVPENANIVNLHLHCDSQTLIQISVPEEKSESAKTNDFNATCSIHVGSKSLKSNRTSPSKFENFLENHEENNNEDLFVRYKDLKYLTILKDGSFYINRPQSKVCRTETNFRTFPDCEEQNMFEQKLCDEQNLEKPINSCNKYFRNDNFKSQSESFTKNEISKNYFKNYMHINDDDDDFIFYNQSVPSDSIKKKKPFSDFSDSKYSNLKESFSRRDLKHLAIKDGLFVLQLPECENSQTSFYTNQSSFENSQSSFKNNQSSFENNQSLFENSQTSFYNNQSSFENSQTSFYNNKSSFENNQFPLENSLSSFKNNQSSFDNIQSSLESSDSKINEPLLKSSNNSKLPTSYCEKKSFCKSDLKHLKINEDGSFFLDLSDSKTKSSLKPTNSPTSSTSHCENKSINKADLNDFKINEDTSSSSDLSDSKTEPSLKSTSSTSSSDNKSISRTDLKHLKINEDGSFFLDLSDSKTKSSLKPTNSPTTSTSHCENKSINEADLNYFKINGDTSSSSDLSDSKTEPSLKSTSSTSYSENKSINRTDLKHLKINEDGSFFLDLSDSATKPSLKSADTSISYCDSKSSLDYLSDYESKPSLESKSTSSSPSNCENKSISKADLKHLKIGADGSFILDIP